MLDFFSAIWNFIWTALKYPVVLWQGECTTEYYDYGTFTDYDTYCAAPDKLGGLIMGFLIYLVTALVVAVIWMILRSVYDRIVYLRDRRHCQHCEHWTTDVSGSSLTRLDYCRPGEPCCVDCQDDHEEREFERDVAQQPKVGCPHGHGDMVKLILDGRIVVDKCSQCEGVFLDKGELDKIEAHNYDSGHDDGYDSGLSSGQSNGMVLGLAVGTAIS